MLSITLLLQIPQTIPVRYIFGFVRKIIYLSYTLVFVHYIVCSVCTSPLVLLRHFLVLQIQLSFTGEFCTLCSVSVHGADPTPQGTWRRKQRRIWNMTHTGDTCDPSPCSTSWQPFIATAAARSARHVPKCKMCKRVKPT